MKGETLQLEVSLQEVELALKQWDQTQAGMKDAFKQLESFSDNAPAAH